MVPFFVLVFVILTSMNAYWIWRVYAAFPQMGRWILVFVAWALLVTAAPFWMRLLPHMRWPSLVVYVWVALMWWFVVAALALDLWNLGAWLVGMALPAARQVMLSPQVRLAIAVTLMILAGTWAAIEAGNIQTRVVTIETPRLPPDSAPIRVVMFSDVHFGVHMGERRTQVLAERLRLAEPDILICGGDLMDAPLERIRPLVELLRGVPAPMGKFAVMGNHEFFTGVDESREVIEAMGHRLLRGESVQVTPLVRLSGVDDPAGAYRNSETFLDEDPLLPKRLERGRYGLEILVKHRPQVDDTSIGRFDVQFSGHSHGGQVWPFHVFSAITNQYLAGFYDVGQGSAIFVSRGAGTWGPPMRLMAPPDIVVVIFKPAPDTAAHIAPPVKSE